MLVPIALATAVAWWAAPLAGLLTLAPGLALWAWGLWFFRDPTRTPPRGDHLVLSPADGRVIKIDHADYPPELRAAAAALGAAGPVQRISIFLNLFNVHVNRAPAAGRIAAVAYVPGKFFNASLDKASLHNERSGALLIDPAGRVHCFVQIAGLVARRIVNHLREGQTVAAGQRFGLIRFGSRAEVYLPPGTALRVAVGDHIRAGESVLAELAALPVAPVVPQRAPAAGAVGAGSVGGAA